MPRIRKMAVLTCVVLLLLLFLILRFFNGYQLAALTNQFLVKFRDPTLPTFWDTSSIAWAQTMRENYKTMHDELLKYESECVVPKYRYVSVEQGGLDRHLDAAWRTLHLIHYHSESAFAWEHFPKTMELVYRIPGISTAYFSILDPHMRLDGHYGVFEGVMRYHLALETPANYSRCFIVVNTERQSYRAGQDMIFDDNQWHYVVNDTPQRRVVMFIDFLRDYHNPILNGLNRFFTFIGSFNRGALDILHNQALYHSRHCTKQAAVRPPH